MEVCNPPGLTGLPRFYCKVLVMELYWTLLSELYTISILLVYWLFGGQSISIKSILYTAPQKASILFIEKGPL